MLPLEVLDDIQSYLTTSASLRWVVAIVLVITGVALGSFVRRLIRRTTSGTGGRSNRRSRSPPGSSSP